MNNTYRADVILGLLALLAFPSICRAGDKPAQSPGKATDHRISAAEALKYFRQNEWGKAAAAYEQVVNVNPNNGQYWHNYGFALHSLKRYDEAASVAYATLFHLMGAWFRRAAVVAVLYSFFLESFMGSMPGYWKRCSISFYTRCLMFAAGEDHGVQPASVSTYIPVTAPTALVALAVATGVFLAWGMIVFSRSEYLDLK